MPHLRPSRLIALLALLALCALATAFSEPPTARTIYGSVVGRNANNCSMWLGIRYAAPPIGGLRWRAPQAPTYAAESDATSFGKACPQSGPWGVPTLSTSEDCLFLNVYAPLWATPESALPVKFWVHGGGFTGGAAAQFNGSALAALTGAVVVTINYRLGIFGFYAIDGLVEESPTLNYGLQDQAFALQWVHDNIAAFGGDPNNVTIFGESAGGCSVHLHLWMPMSQGLFHRAIMESPGPWFLYTTEQLTYANQAFLPSPCNKGGLSAKDVLKCMRGFDTYQAMATQTMPIPAIDGQQILAQPLALWATYHRPPNMVPLMVGTNSYEGNLFTWLFLGPTLNVSEQFYESFWAFAMARYLPPTANVTLLKELYDPIANSSGYFAGISAVYGDMFINCGAWAVVSAAAALNQEPVYRYLFEHATTSWLYTPLNATHGAEIPYVWHQDNWAGCNLTDSEWGLSQTMLGMWDGFARAADPGAMWAPYTPNSPSILGLQVDAIAPIPDPQYDSGCDFFLSLFTQQF